jgi:uncharacterized protein (DUF305 family)
MGLCVRLIATALLWSAATASGQSSSPASESAPIVQPGAPGESSKRITAAEAAPPLRAPSAVDVSFMQGMIMHHSQAVEMTDLLRVRSHNKELLELGKRISISQTDEMKYMKQWLQDRHAPVEIEQSQMHHMEGMKGSDHMAHMNMSSMPLMPGMLSPQQMMALERARGATFDHLFLTGMIQHHTGALVMVQDLFDTPGAGQDAVLFDFASDVDNTQRAEISIMRSMLLKEKK